MRNALITRKTKNVKSRFNYRITNQEEYTDFYLAKNNDLIGI